MSIYTAMAESHPDLQSPRVRCERCGRQQTVDATTALRAGWPECCGYTMTLLTTAQKAQP